MQPENILWSTNDQEAILKIADFGFAKISNDCLMTTACGTPLFISPEILNGEPYDRSVDFWSLGIILYILYISIKSRLSGKSPFEAED
jgi:calcium/calmodulin-dependent protein kinase I